VRHYLLVGTTCILALTFAAADDEGRNEPVVVAAEYGSCYAKSVPSDEYGERGTTKIFAVQRGTDTLIQTYPWFAQELYVDCPSPYSTPPRVSVVQLGPWPRGRTANAETLAIAFYLDGRLLKRYSTLDIAGSPTNVHASSHHYTVFEKVFGYRWGTGHQRFVVRTTDGRTLVFDSDTGSLVEDKNVPLERP